MERDVHLVDASNKIAGRIASRIATLLQGKHKPSFQPYLDCGDIVHVSNVSQMKFSGKKLEKKIYYRYSGYPGGIKSKQLSERMTVEPDKVLRDMVYNMLPENKLRALRMRRLRFL